MGVIPICRLFYQSGIHLRRMWELMWWLEDRFPSIPRGINFLAEDFPVALPRMCFFRAKNGSALTWFVDPAKGFFMADQVIPPDFPHGIWKKDEKIGGALICLPTRRKPSNGAGCAIQAGNVRLSISLPFVGTIDQKMNGLGLFRSEYAAGDTGSDPHLAPEAEVKPHM